LEIIKRCGGWPVVDGSTWNEEDFSWREMYYHLRKAGLKSGTILSFSITNDLKNSTKRVIKLDQPTFGCDRAHLRRGMESKIVREYHRYQVDLAVIFGASRPRAEDEMKDVLDFEMKLANVSAARSILLCT